MKFLIFITLSISPFLLFAGFLTGILGILGKSRREGSLKLLQCSGVREGRIFLPFFFLALIFSILSLYLTAYLMPQASFRLKELSGRKKILTQGILTNKFRDYVLMVKRVRGNFLEDITLLKTEKDGARRIIFAPYGKFSYNTAQNILTLELFQGWIDEFHPEKKESIRGKFARYRIELKPRKSPGRPDKTPFDMTWKELEKNRKFLQGKGVHFRILEVEKERRTALSLSPFLLLFLGIWTGKRWGRGGRWQSIGLSFPILLGVYLLFSLAHLFSIKGAPASLLFTPYLLLLGLIKELKE